jgi:hypothetical protein
MDSLFIKVHHAGPMLQSSHLDLDPELGILGDINPSGKSPRQVCIATVSGLLDNNIKVALSRANVVLDGEVGTIGSGSLLSCGTASIRVTFSCEPCAHGAHMAEARMSDFRKIDRYLGLVLHKGRLTEGEYLNSDLDAYPAVPDTFKERCAWALDSIPKGHVITSLEFLRAIGASRSYLRALPRWLSSASCVGKPTHRVLTAALAAPTWAPDAVHILAKEDLAVGEYSEMQFPLAEALWYPPSGR